MKKENLQEKVNAHRRIELLRDRLCKLKEECIKGIILFGSLARGEEREKSDVDLLVLHEGCSIRDPVERRRYLYEIVKMALRRDFESITIIDMELTNFIKPVEITPLLLNIYWDGIVLLDRTNSLKEFLGYVKKRIVLSGLKRVKNGKAYYWILPEPLKEVKIL